MKTVSLALIALTISLGAAAQTSNRAVEKETVAKIQQKKKGQKAKTFKKKTAATDSTATTTLRDERSHKAKWSFETMLQRRLEIDAAAGDRKRVEGIE